MRALPHAYRNVGAEPDTLLLFEISGDAGGRWHLHREGGAWRLRDRAIGKPAAHVTIPQEIAWRIFTKGLDPASAAIQTRFDGNQELGQYILQMKAIVG